MTMHVLQRCRPAEKVQRHCDAMMQSRALTRADARIQPRWQSEKQVNRPLQEIPAKMSVEQQPPREWKEQPLSRKSCNDQDDHGAKSAVERRADEARAGRMTSVSRRETAMGMAEPRRGRSERLQPRDDQQQQVQRPPSEDEQV